MPVDTKSSKLTWSYRDYLVGHYRGDVAKATTTHVGSYSTITGYRGPRRSGEMHPCTHTIAQYIASNLNLEAKYPYGQGTTYERFEGQLPLVGDLSCTGQPVIEPSDLDDAITQLRGEIPTDVLGINFLLELPEALTLHSQLSAVFSNRRVKTWSDAGLAYSFGLAPLVSDLGKLFHMSNRISRRIRYLQSIRDDDLTPLRIGVRLSKATSFVVQPRCYFSYLKARDNGTWSTASLFCHARRTRTLGSSGDRAAAWLDATGFSKFGSSIWEAIPFSFVADWFYPCGRALKVLDTSAFEGCLLADRIGWQDRIVSDIELHGNIKVYVCSYPDTVVGHVLGKTYNRSLGLPSTHPISHYGLRQSVLSGMLAVQRLKS